MIVKVYTYIGFTKDFLTYILRTRIYKLKAEAVFNAGLLINSKLCKKKEYKQIARMCENNFLSKRTRKI